MRSVWNGSISFGLVNIPIKLYSAIEAREGHFKMLCKKCKSPIHYKRTCKCQDDIPWDEVAKGIEISKGNYYLVDDEELKQIKPEKTQRIDVQEFVNAQQIDPILLDKHYYIGPSKEGEKAFFLLKEVLQSTAKVAIGRFVMREREYVCTIEHYHEGMMLTTLNYAYEIRDIKEIKELKSAPKMEAQEMKLAKQLIDNLYQEEFDMSKFKDNFMEELRKLLKQKQKGKPIHVEEVKKEPTENLIEALRASLK